MLMTMTDVSTACAEVILNFDSEDDNRSGCWNVSHCHQQFFSELSSDDTRQTTNEPNATVKWTHGP